MDNDSDGGRDVNAPTPTIRPMTWDEWSAKHLAAARIVAERGGRMVGWAALMPVSPRVCYRGVAEVSVYVGDGARGTGVGRDPGAPPTDG